MDARIPVQTKGGEDVVGVKGAIGDALPIGGRRRIDASMMPTHEHLLYLARSEPLSPITNPSTPR